MRTGPGQPKHHSQGNGIVNETWQSSGTEPVPPSCSFFLFWEHSLPLSGSNCLGHPHTIKKSGYQEHRVLRWESPAQALPAASLVPHARDASGFVASDLFPTYKEELSFLQSEIFTISSLFFLIPSKTYCYSIARLETIFEQKIFSPFFQ